MNDGQGKQHNGTQASAPSTRQTDQLEDQKKKRWEDEINDFLKPEETEETEGNEIKNNDTWIKVAKNRERWKTMESEYATTAAAVSVGHHCFDGKSVRRPHRADHPSTK